MKPIRLAIGLGAMLALGSSLALAAPGYEQSHQPPPRHAAPPQHQAPHTSRHPAMQSGPPPRQQAHPGARAHQPPVRHGRPAHQASRPPTDFRPVRVQIHANRHHIGYGPALPPHVHIMRGKPLPPGWGRRLNTHQHRYVPHYQGYEWRRAGGDLVLVALTTGIVHEILHDVLR
jgi:Ni/Co efflux regulator RcnB